MEEFFNARPGLAIASVLFWGMAIFVVLGMLDGPVRRWRRSMMSRFWAWNDRKYGPKGGLTVDPPPPANTVPLIRQRPNMRGPGGQATLHLQDRRVQRVPRFLGVDIPRGVVMETNPGMPNRYGLRFPRGFYLPREDQRRLQTRAGNAFHFEVFTDQRTQSTFINVTEQLSLEFMADSQEGREYLSEIVAEVCSLYADWAIGKANAQVADKVEKAEKPVVEPSRSVRMRQRRAASVERQSSNKSDTVDPSKQEKPDEQ
jgi:hypothetical protein